MSRGAPARLIESGAADTVTVPLNELPLAFGSEYEYEPAVWNVHDAVCVGWSTTGFGVQATPVVGLKTIWCTTESLLTNCTESPSAIVVAPGTYPALVMVTVATAAAATPLTASAAAAAKSRRNFRMSGKPLVNGPSASTRGAHLHGLVLIFCPLWAPTMRVRRKFSVSRRVTRRRASPRSRASRRALRRLRATCRSTGGRARTAQRDRPATLLHRRRGARGTSGRTPRDPRGSGGTAAMPRAARMSTRRCRSARG